MTTTTTPAGPVTGYRAKVIGNYKHDEGAVVVVLHPTLAQYGISIARLRYVNDLNDPVAIDEDDHLLDSDEDVDTLVRRVAAAWASNPRTWPEQARLWRDRSGDGAGSLVAVRFTWAARTAMAETIHQADKGRHLDSSPSWVRDRYIYLADAALRHAADVAEVVVMEPVDAGWCDDVIAVGVDEVPEGFEPLYRVAGGLTLV